MVFSMFTRGYFCQKLPHRTTPHPAVPEPDHAKSAPSQAARYSAAVHLADGSMAYPLCFTAGIDGCETFQIKKASQTGQIY